MRLSAALAHYSSTIHKTAVAHQFEVLVVICHRPYELSLEREVHWCAGQSGDHWASAKASPRRSTRTVCGLRASGSTTGSYAATNVCGVSCRRCSASPQQMRLQSPMHAALAEVAAAGHQQRRPLEVCFHLLVRVKVARTLFLRLHWRQVRRQESVGPWGSAMDTASPSKSPDCHVDGGHHCISCTHLILLQLYNHQRSSKRQAADETIECAQKFNEAILAFSDAGEQGERTTLAAVTPGGGNAAASRLPAGFSVIVHRERMGTGEKLRVAFRAPCLKHDVAPSLASPSALRSFFDKHANCRHASHPSSKIRS